MMKRWPARFVLRKPVLQMETGFLHFSIAYALAFGLYLQMKTWR